MALLEIRVYPDPVLREKSAPIAEVTPEIRRLAADMLETMYAAPGVGLAAIQVGCPIRLVVADPCPSGPDSRPLVLVNPVVSARSQETELMEEGCLSLPEIHADVERPRRITIEAADLEGNPIRLADDETISRILQHELDHLDGILFTDYLSQLKRRFLLRRVVRR